MITLQVGDGNFSLESFWGFIMMFPGFANNSMVQLQRMLHEEQRVLLLETKLCLFDGKGWYYHNLT
jgi:hypothetical protein